MWQKFVDFVKNTKWMQFLLVFFAGAFFAAVFYPTKQIKETLEKTYQQKISTLQQQSAQELATQQSSYQQLSNQYSSYKSQTDAKINELTNQVTHLKSHTKTTTYKVVHPDGTIEERETSESSTDQSDEITQEVQQEWQQKTDQAVQTATAQLQQQIITLQTQVTNLQKSNSETDSTETKTKTETINPKNFTIDAGLMTNGDYSGHVTYNVWGPFIIGAHGEFGSSPAGGLSVGLRF